MKTVLERSGKAAGHEVGHSEIGERVGSAVSAFSVIWPRAKLSCQLH